jgi:hypothetical protein
MKVVKIAVALAVLGSGLVLSGCREGGQFFSDIERSIYREGMNTNDFYTAIRMFGEREKGKKDELFDRVSAYRDKENVHNQELHADFRRFMTGQQEVLPDLTAPDHQAIVSGGKVVNRAFPGVATED